MVEEEFVGILSYDLKGNSGGIFDIAWDISNKGNDLGYYVFLAWPRHDPNEWDRLSRIDRDIMQLMWTRLPPFLESQRRIYFAINSSPFEHDVDGALGEELNPLRLRPMDDSKPGARKPPSDIRFFRLIRHMWERLEVVDGIFAAFTWEMSWPHLEERKCTFDEMLADLYHWFDHRPGWKDKTYYVNK